MSWKDTIKPVEESSWKDTIQPVEQPEWKQYVPFMGGTKKEHTPAAKADAQELLKQKGFDPDSWTDSAWTGILGLADTLSFGNQAEIQAVGQKLEDMIVGREGKSYDDLKKMYEAAYTIRSEAQPISSLVGEVGGYIPGSLATGAARAVGVAVDESEDVAKDVIRTLGEEAVGLGVGKVIGKILSGSSTKSVTNELMDNGLGSEQAEAIVQRAADLKVGFDETLQSINQLEPQQVQEFEKIILAGQKVQDYPYEDLGEALDTYRDMLAKKAAMLEETGLDPSSAAFIGMKFMDPQYVGNMADRRYGTDLMPTMNQLSRDFTKGLWEAKDMKQSAQKLIDSLGVDSKEKSLELIKQVEAGQGPEELTQLFEAMRVRANELYGEEVIAKRANYIPHYTKRSSELVGTLRNRIRKTTGTSPGEIDLKNLDAIKSDKELMDSLKYVGGYLGKYGNKLNDTALIKLVRSLNHSKTTKKVLDNSAASVKERLSEEVPELIRETDIGRLMGGWIDSVTSDATMRKNLRKVRADSAAIKPVDPQLAAYLNNYVNDLSGGSTHLAGWAREKMTEFAAKSYDKAAAAKDAGKETLANFYETVAEFPQYMQYMQAQLYPYFLGMRIDAVGRNLTQPYMLTIPEIGGSAAYKTKLIANSMPNTIKGMFTGEKSKVFQELKEGGWMPPDPTPGQFQALRKGVQAGGSFKKGARKALEKANNLAMIGYQQSDIANRVVTLGVGKQLAKDIIAGNKNAMEYVKRLPPAYRSQVLEGLAAGNEKIVRDRVLDHLMATTQFNYNRASMSEYGRQMGSAFSQFSKWPTAIGADIFDGYDAARFEKTRGGTRLPSGSEKLIRKYIAPYLMLVGASNLYFGEDGPSPREKQLFSADPSSAAPISSVTSLSDPGRAFTPPVYQAMKEFVSGNGVDTTFGLLPLATYGRFYTERLPPLIEDERGQKPTEALLETME